MKIRWWRRHPASTPRPLATRLARLARLVYNNVVRVHGRPAEVGAGAAVGVALGVLPTFGLGIPLAVFLAWALRLNKAAALAGSMVANPLTTPFIWTASAFIGALVAGGDWRAIAAQARGAHLFAAATRATWIYLAGNTALTVVAASAAYGLTYCAIKRRRARRAGAGDRGPTPGGNTCEG